MRGKIGAIVAAAVGLVLLSATGARAQESGVYGVPNSTLVIHTWPPPVAPPVQQAAALGPPDKIEPVPVPAPDPAPALPSPSIAPTHDWLYAYRLPPLSEASFPPLAGDPLLDEPNFPPPGFYADLGVGAAAVHFKDRFFGQVPLGAGPAPTVHVPGAPLDWTAAPDVELGYRMARGYGEFLVRYRSLATEGTETLAPAYGNAVLHSRLNVSQADFDYAHYHALAPLWDMRWRIGAELTAAFYDSRSLQPTGAGTDEQRAANNFVGAGPHAGLELWRHLENVPGLALYLNADAATPVGRLHQSFEEIVTTTATVGGASRDSIIQALAVLDFQAGLSWSPPWCKDLRFTGGYQLQQWFQLGSDPNNGSMGSLTEHAIFIRAQFNF